MWYRKRSAVLLTAMWLVTLTLASPVKRAQEVEARRRSAIDRNMIRLGRSSPPELTAAEIREAFQRSNRRSNSFLRLGRSQPLTLTSDDLINLLRAYNEDDGEQNKRASNFIRLGRDPKFIRLGRTPDEDKGTGYDVNTDAANTYPQRKGRARDLFLRLGRDSEELNENDFDEEAVEERRKRSVTCPGCQS